MHGFGARLAAIPPAFRQGCNDENDHVAPGSTARPPHQRAHFMDIGLFRAETPLGRPFDRANSFEVSLPVGAMVVRARFPESLVLPPLGPSSRQGLAATPVSPLFGLPSATAAVLRSIPVLGPRDESVTAPLEEALPATARFF